MPFFTTLYKNMKNELKISLQVLFGFILLFIVLNCFTTIDNGVVGYTKLFGKINKERVLLPGFHIVNPFSNVIEVDSKQQAVMIDRESVYSSDTQNIEIKVKFVYVYRNIPDLITNYPNVDVVNNLVTIPRLKQEIKNIFGKHIADSVVSNREKITKDIFDNLKAIYENSVIEPVSFNIENIDFSDGYERAIEQKSIAFQKSQEEKNITAQFEEKAKQRLIEARAEAESMRIQSQALQQNKSLIEYEAVKKWNGVLPSVTGGNIPFINIK
ncbi:MAG: prohibitin family protein [Rickettsiales bacterium]|nr:MAG: prohibitin family protein [Rickettsiales bacterium]